MANATYIRHWLTELTGKTRMNIGVFFAPIAVAVIWFICSRTTLGYLKSAELVNPHAPEYAGVLLPRTIILSMIISGAPAGLCGAMEGLGTFQNVYVQGSSLAIGFNGMAVRVWLRHSPHGILSLQPSYLAFSKLGLLVWMRRRYHLSLSALSASIISTLSEFYLISSSLSKKKQELKEVSKDVYYNLAPSWCLLCWFTQHLSHLYKYRWCFLWVVVWYKREPWRNYGYGCLFWSCL